MLLVAVLAMAMAFAAPAAVQEGGIFKKSGAARLFNVSLSSLKRYARIANQGAFLQPRKGSR